MNIQQAAETGFRIGIVGGRGGAEISGVKLSGNLPATTVKLIRDALLEYKVIFFRGQTHLTDQQHEAFAFLLGQPTAHPTVPVVANTNYVMELDSDHDTRAETWHSDVTFVEAYPFASILRGVVIPESGGDTLWSNTEAAYEHLPEVLKGLADRLRAVHSNKYDYFALRPDVSRETVQRFNDQFASTVYEAEHPVVRVHPETGKRALVLGHFVSRIVGLPSHDSKMIFELLQRYATLEENTVRWRWREGDVAIWDNRATQHKALNDYGHQRRIMRRVTIRGDVPVGVDGRPSQSLDIRSNAAL